MSKIAVVSGGFDPIHSGHIKLLNDASILGDILIVALNSDAWLTRKKGREFMPWDERAIILSNMRMVHSVIDFDDSDGSAIHALETIKTMYPDSEIIFANGGDRTQENIPEMSVEGITFKFEIGGEDKSNSSSWILEEWKAPKTERQWGYYRVLHEVEGTKVKELTVEPGQSLSMQRHRDRSEYWLVTSGQAVVNATMNNGYALPSKHICRHDTYKVAVGEWHQLTNPFDVPCKIVEIQYGTGCTEEDIERK
jgi:cytidyltransferase-like protein